MAILWVNLVIVYVVSFFSRYVAKPVTMGTGPVVVRPNMFMTAIVITTFVLVSGLRINIGDTYFYMHAFAVNTYSWEFILSQKDIGFGIIQMGLQKFTRDPQVLIFTTALITNVLIVHVLHKYSRLFELSIFVYITSGLYIVSMNGVRQFLASSIIFLATQYIFEGNWKKYILVVLVASTIHQSALILIPIYFIIRRKAWTSMTFFLLFMAVILVVGYNQFSSAIFSAIQGTQYGDYSSFNEGGANMLRVVIQAIPVFFAFLGRKKLREVFPQIDYVVNMSLLSVIIMVIATQNWIFARFIIYFGMYNLILIPYIVEIFAKRYHKLIYFAIFIFYLSYFYYENAIILRLVYRSNYFN